MTSGQLAAVNEWNGGSRSQVRSSIRSALTIAIRIVPIKMTAPSVVTQVWLRFNATSKTISTLPTTATRMRPGSRANVISTESDSRRACSLARASSLGVQVTGGNDVVKGGHPAWPKQDIIRVLVRKSAPTVPVLLAICREDNIVSYLHTSKCAVVIH